MKVAFLDRDGVLNLKPPNVYYVTRMEDFLISPGAVEGIAALVGLGYRVMVATNQRAVAKGLLPMEVLEAMHRRLSEAVAEAGGRIDRFYICPHEKDSCECRKPKPGLFLQAFRDYPEIDRAASFFAGDSDSDRVAADAAGLKFIPVQTNGKLDDALRSAGISR
jgi:D-glycero-D-manno-heptose 1,7-bisphosphate phosphatase